MVITVHVSAQCNGSKAGPANLPGADALRWRPAKFREAGGAASEDTFPRPRHDSFGLTGYVMGQKRADFGCSDAERFVMRLREDTPKPTRKPRTPSLRTQAKYISREMSEQFGLAQKDLARRARVSCLPP